MLCTVRRQAMVVEIRQLQVLEEQPATGRTIQAAHDVQKRRFSAARRA
jgi:hypothetical protein